MMKKFFHPLFGMLASLGRSVFFLLDILRNLPSLRNHFRIFIQQIHAIGVMSLVIIIVAGLFVGMVLGLQGYNTLVRFGAEQTLGVVVALSLLRELGPVLSALLFAGRAGSALAAEVGLMRATDQLDAMEMMAVNPIQEVIAPRFVAGILALPLLTIVFNVVGILGGYLVGVEFLGVDSGTYWAQIQSGASFGEDVGNGLIKSFVFGIVIMWIAMVHGYYATPTSEGVSRATTHTVVIASLLVLGLDFILTGFMFTGI